MNKTIRTTIHVPASVVAKIDKVAKVRGYSRNQSIIYLLQIAIADDPQGLLELTKQSPDSTSADSEKHVSGAGPL